MRNWVNNTVAWGGRFANMTQERFDRVKRPVASVAIEHSGTCERTTAFKDRIGHEIARKITIGRDCRAPLDGRSEKSGS